MAKKRKANERGKVAGKLVVPCAGPGCDSDLEVREQDLSVCHDRNKTFFGIYVRCQHEGCEHENLVREDLFLSKSLFLECPGCEEMYAVTFFEWSKEGKYRLSFETFCTNCNVHVTARWSH